MNSNEKRGFHKRLAAVYSYYRADCTEDVSAMWWAGLKPFALELVEQAFNKHAIDTERGQYLPKIADIIRIIEQLNPDGRPDPEEAWAIMSPALHDEGVTVVATGEMLAAFTLAQESYQDRVGSRMSFLEKYRNLVKYGRDNRLPVVWTPSLGWNVDGRKAPLEQAVRLGRLTQDHASLLLGPPAPAVNLLPSLGVKVKGIS